MNNRILDRKVKDFWVDAEGSTESEGQVVLCDTRGLSIRHTKLLHSAVPQEFALGPLLFQMYVVDIENDLKN